MNVNVENYRGFDENLEGAKDILEGGKFQCLILYKWEEGTVKKRRYITNVQRWILEPVQSRISRKYNLGRFEKLLSRMIKN